MVGTCHSALCEANLGAYPGLGALHLPRKKSYLGIYPRVGTYLGYYGYVIIRQLKEQKALCSM